MKPVYTTTEEVAFKNDNGSSKKSPKCPNCGSWIKHWEGQSNKQAKKCAVVGCDEDATDGAHILRTNSENEDYKKHPYILPLCHDHNMKTEKLKVKAKSTFVWANVQKTCGK